MLLTCPGSKGSRKAKEAFSSRKSFGGKRRQQEGWARESKHGPYIRNLAPTLDKQPAR